MSFASSTIAFAADIVPTLTTAEELGAFGILAVIGGDALTAVSASASMTIQTDDKKI